MSKHTPGPWQYRPDVSPGEVWDSEFRPVVLIADLDEEGATPSETDLANGKLIAGAPDMLRTLMLVERLLQMNAITPRNRADVLREVQNAIGCAVWRVES